MDYKLVRGTGVATGVDNYTVTGLSVKYSTLKEGFYWIDIPAINTGVSDVNIDGTGVIAIKYNTATLTGGELGVRLHKFYYDGTDMNLLDRAAPDTVFGRIGAVIATLNDYVASLIGNDSGVTGPTVKDALDTLSADISTLVSGQVNKPAVDTTTCGLGNITLSGEQTLNGLLTSASDVLVCDQTLPEENGIYITAVGAWARRADYDTDAEVNNGDIIHVINAGSDKNLWKHLLVTADPITVGTTGLDFEEHPNIAAASDVTNDSGVSGASVKEALDNTLPRDLQVKTEALPYELVAADNGKHIELTGTGALTVPTGLAAGFQVSISLDNATKQTLTTTGNTVKTFNASTANIAGNGSVTIARIAANVIRIIGNTEP